MDTRYGTLTVEKLGRGQKVLHVRTERNSRAFLRVDDFAAPGNSFYGRLRVDAFPRQPDWAHYTFIEAIGEGPEVVRRLGGRCKDAIPGRDAISHFYMASHSRSGLPLALHAPGHYRRTGQPGRANLTIDLHRAPR